MMPRGSITTPLPEIECRPWPLGASQMMFTSAPRISVAEALISPVGAGVATRGADTGCVGVAGGVAGGFGLTGVVVAAGFIEVTDVVPVEVAVKGGNSTSGSVMVGKTERPVEVACTAGMFRTTVVPVAKYPTKSASSAALAMAKYADGRRDIP